VERPLNNKGAKRNLGYFVLCRFIRLRFFLLCFAILERRFFLTDAIEVISPNSPNVGDKYGKLTVAFQVKR